MAETLPEDVTAGTEGHPHFHEVIHAFVNSGGGRQDIVWSGDLVVATGTRYHRVRVDSGLASFNFSAGVAPVTVPIIFDVLRNGVSIFASPPQIAVGETHVNVAPIFPFVDAGDLLTIDIIQIDAAGVYGYVESYAVAA